MDFKQFYKTINFDIDNEIRTVFQATQGDTKSRGLLVDLIVGGVKTPITTEKMTFFALKPDGTRVMTVGIKEGTGFRIDFTNQTFAVPGVLLCTLVLSGTNGEKIADKKFKMTVDSSLEDGAIISEDERGILDRAFDLATDIVPRLEGLDVPLLENLEQEVTEITNVKLPEKVDKSQELSEQHIIKTLPNKVKDKLTQTLFVKNVETYAIAAGDVVQLFTSGTNLDIVQISKKANDILKNQLVRTNYAFKFDGFETFNVTVSDQASNIGKSYNMTNDHYGLCVAKGTYASLASAKTALTGLSVSYQLATPQNIALPTIATPNTKEIARLSEENERKANKVQEEWNTPTLLNGWDNYSSTYSQCGYFKDQFGIVHLKGFVRSGVIGQDIFMLPTGYRPASLSYFSTISNNVAGVVTISNGGNVRCTVGNNEWVTLDGITFRGV